MGKFAVSLFLIFV